MEVELLFGFAVSGDASLADIADWVYMKIVASALAGNATTEGLNLLEQAQYMGVLFGGFNPCFNGILSSIC